MSLSFIRGMVAAVNPCGFILLPTYLMYFLGLQGTMPGSQRATMRRAVIVSAAVSTGFLSVFLIAGLIAYNFTSWINENAKYATGVHRGGLLVLGIAMLFGYKLPFMTPRLDAGGDGPRQTVGAMFVYGIAYAVASIGCTIGLFMATVFSTSERDGWRRRRGQHARLRRRHGAAGQRPHHRAGVGEHRPAQAPARQPAVRRPHRCGVRRAVGPLPALVLLLGRHPRGGRPDHRLGAERRCRPPRSSPTTGRSSAS
jgi:hypothetical protein